MLQLDALTVPKFGATATATAAADTATACKGRHRDTNTAEKTGNPGKAQVPARTWDPAQDLMSSLVYAGEA